MTAHGAGKPTWAVDIGGTKTLLGRLGGGVLTVVAVIRTPDDPAVLAAWLRRQVPGRVARLGVAFPGGLDEDGRVTAWPNRPEWVGYGLRDALGRIARAVVLRDDGESAAAAEAMYGIAQGRPDALVAVLGTGLGGALVLDGKVRRSAPADPRTLGHLAALPEGSCGCGGTGCAQLALRTLPPDDRLGDGLEGWPDGLRLVAFLGDLVRFLSVPTVVLTGGLLARPVLRAQMRVRMAACGVEVLVPARPGLSSLLGAAALEMAG
ncbi:ROK family protein [Streptomyces paludis]|uniref:ROK family protein n=1 Tax=Streptomyces paludis TaxID=2282738 RepID=UPI0013B37A72|nr:ROK family protein [Streptomyces paludis]